MKKYKIANKFRFITFCTVVMLIISFSISGLLGINKAQGSEQQKYVEVQVVSGDTLWQIAKTYGDHSKDIRKVIYDICQTNNITADTLQAGQTLLIPIK